MLLEQLLESIPSDTEERVRRTRDRLNQNIREILRQETGLRFRRMAKTAVAPDDGRQGISEAVTVRVQIVPGLPTSLRGREISDRDRLAALIAPWRDSLERLRDSAKDTDQLAFRLYHDPLGHALVGDGASSLHGVIDLAEHLLAEAKKFNLAEWILEVNEDVLGAYAYYVPDRRGQVARKDAWIELYWGVIGLLSRVLAVEVEDLTVVVLAHELAHAYTQLGSDIDGSVWEPADFAASEHGLKEGLAQYYGLVACRRLELAAPNATKAFAALLENQPAAYKTRQPWVKENKPEEIRLAMIRARRSGEATLGQFNKLLKKAESDLRSGNGQSAEQP
jgi:hypothetical protein